MPGAYGKLQGAREGDSDMAGSNTSTVSPTGLTQTRSDNLTIVPTSGPRELELVLKCKMLTLSLVEPSFEKHKVLFILTFFF